MKRILCVLLMLCLLAPAALAEEAASLNWETVVPVLEAGNVTGQFYTFDEIAVKIWLPDGMLPVELTEEDREKGYIGYFMPEDESAQMAVMYVDIKGMSLEEYAQELASDSRFTDIEQGTVNGLPCNVGGLGILRILARLLQYLQPFHNVLHNTSQCSNLCQK